MRSGLAVGLGTRGATNVSRNEVLETEPLNGPRCVVDRVFGADDKCHLPVWLALMTCPFAGRLFESPWVR